MTMLQVELDAPGRGGEDPGGVDWRPGEDGVRELGVPGHPGGTDQAGVLLTLVLRGIEFIMRMTIIQTTDKYHNEYH